MVSSNQPISYEVESVGDGTTCVDLSGSLCDDGIDVAREALTQCIADRPARLGICMAGVDYISSSGIGMMVSILKRCHQAGVDFAVYSLTPDIHELFTLTRLDQVFTIAADFGSWHKSFDAAD